MKNELFVIQSVGCLKLKSPNVGNLVQMAMRLYAKFHKHTRILSGSRNNG